MKDLIYWQNQIKEQEDQIQLKAELSRKLRKKNGEPKKGKEAQCKTLESEINEHEFSIRDARHEAVRTQFQDDSYAKIAKEIFDIVEREGHRAEGRDRYPRTQFEAAEWSPSLSAIAVALNLELYSLKKGYHTAMEIGYEFARKETVIKTGKWFLCDDPIVDAICKDAFTDIFAKILTYYIKQEQKFKIERDQERQKRRQEILEARKNIQDGDIIKNKNGYAVILGIDSLDHQYVTYLSDSKGKPIVQEDEYIGNCIGRFCPTETYEKVGHLSLEIQEIQIADDIYRVACSKDPRIDRSVSQRTQKWSFFKKYAPKKLLDTFYANESENYHSENDTLIDNFWQEFRAKNPNGLYRK